MLQAPITRTFRVGHMAYGIGAGAKGFNQANPRVGAMSARFECAGGIDIDAGAIRNWAKPLALALAVDNRQKLPA